MRDLCSNQRRLRRECDCRFRGPTIRSLALLLLGTLTCCTSIPGPMTGTWALMLTSSDSLDQTAASLNLQQSGNTLSGTINRAGCTQPPNISGTLNNNNTFSLHFLEPTASGDLTGTTNSGFTSATGTYAISGQSCVMNSGSGTWSAVFVGG